MNIVVCIFIFLYINGLGWKYITSGKRFEKALPWAPQTVDTFSGAEMFVLLTLSCAIIASAPLGLLAGRLLLWLLLFLVGLYRAKTFSFGFCSFLYSFYLILILFSLFWSPAPIYGFRVFLKYLLPFMILIFVPVITNNCEIFPHGIKLVCKTLTFYFITYFLGVIGLGILIGPVIGGIWWWGPAILDSFSIFLPITIIASKIFADKRYLWLIIAMTIIPLIGYVVRTGLVALAVTTVAMSVFHYKLKAVPPLIILIIVAFLSVVFIPQLREKMFYEQYATEAYAKDWENWSWDAVNSNGRFAMWDDCLCRFFYHKPWIGSGAGAEQDYLYYQHEKTGIAGICHCDYVQLLCDNGLIGIILYGASLMTLIVHSFFLYNDQQKHIYCRYSAFIAGTGMCGMAAAMMTDNVVNYTMCTLVFPFTFYAMALGLRKFPPSTKVKNVQCSHTALQ